MQSTTGKGIDTTQTTSQEKYIIQANNVRLEHIIALAFSNGVKVEVLRDYLKSYNYSNQQIEEVLSKIIQSSKES